MRGYEELGKDLCVVFVNRETEARKASGAGIGGGSSWDDDGRGRFRSERYVELRETRRGEASRSGSMVRSAGYDATRVEVRGAVAGRLAAGRGRWDGWMGSGGRGVLYSGALTSFWWSR